MVAPWQETQLRVVVEFKKSGEGARRKILLTHNADQPVLPPQLYGRVTPEAWGLLMTDIGQLALQHPYVQTPSASYCCSWLVGMLMVLTVGFGCFQGEDYSQWLAQVNAVLDRHRPTFAHGGCNLSVQRVHGSYWVQIDINPMAVAVGAPVAAAPYYQPQPGAYPPPQPGAYPPPQPGAYPPPQPGAYPPPQPGGYPPQQPGPYPPPAGYPPSAPPLKAV